MGQFEPATLNFIQQRVGALPVAFQERDNAIHFLFGREQPETEAQRILRAVRVEAHRSRATAQSPLALGNRPTQWKEFHDRRESERHLVD